jgi:two-component system, cell cycle sensor histidine kinase PleC
MTDTAAIAAPHQLRLACDQLGLALRNLKPNHWLMPVFGAIIWVMFARWVSTPVLSLWLGLVMVGGAPLGWVVGRYSTLPREQASAALWARYATLAYLLFTISWSAMGMLFWRRGDDLNHMLIMLIIGCTLSGNLALVGASRPLTTVGYAIYGSTLVLLPLQEGGIIYDGLALLALLYGCYLAYMSRQIYFTARDMLVLRDDKNALITALAHSKVQSDAAAQRAEAANRAKSQFLANMSHELRTPLNAILGFSEMIQSGHFKTQSGKHVEYAKLIHRSGHHLLGLINDILDLAKIEAGGLRLHETDVDLAALVESNIALMAGKAEAAGISLKAEIAPGLPMVRADERALTQILINLLSNAVKFTSPGGRVTAFARLEPDGAMALGIRDTGIGIAEEDHARVFEHFGQGRHDIVTADKGTGLGLPIVRGLASAHGGRVELESRVGQGTTVTVILPSLRRRERLREVS